MNENNTGILTLKDMIGSGYLRKQSANNSRRVFQAVVYSAKTKWGVHVLPLLVWHRDCVGNPGSIIGCATSVLGG